MTIKLVIGGTEHQLTIEEAKALHAELAKMFGKAPIVIEKAVPWVVPYTPPIFVQPVMPRPEWEYPQITCLAQV